MDADTTSPAVAISSDASAPVTGPFSIAIAFSEPVTGFELEDLVVADLTPVPALPMAGAIALAVLLLVGGVRRWAAS